MTSYIQFRKKLIASIFLVMPLLFTYSEAYTQTNSTSDGDWNTASNWSSGVPAQTEVANVSNNMTVSSTLFVKNGGNYTITGSLVSTSGIELTGTGQFTVDGNVSFTGNFELKNNSTLTIKSGDTLIVDGNFIMNNTSTLIVEAGAAFIIGGNVELKNSSSGTVDGNMTVDGNYESNNGSSLSGSGNLEVDGSITTNGGSTVFGSSGDCDPGPCEEGSGVGLPVKLISLKAQAITSENLLVEWETLSEVNNEYFSLLISTDGKSFTEVKQIPGSGSSARRLVYQTSIAIPEADYVYLQIMQTDYDGKFQKFNPIVISTKNQSGPKASFSAYPNPGTGEQISLSFKNANPGNYQLNIRSINGQTLHEESLAISDQFDLQNFIVYPQLTLKAGIYQISIVGPSKTYSTRYLVQP